MFKKVFQVILKRYFYVTALIIAIAYFTFYTAYLLIDAMNNALIDYDTVITFGSKVAFLFFTAGIFSASVKYIQFLDVFENEFKKVIMSEEFTKQLNEQISLVTFSDLNLSKQTNIEEIWEIVTLYRYKQRFPAIYEKIKKKIVNQYFKVQNIAYYYRNFQMHLDMSVAENGLINIVQEASYTIIRPDESEFDWDFKFTYYKDQSAELYCKINNCDGKEFKDEDCKETKKNKFTTKKLSAKLSDKTEYHVERTITATQNIDLDRVYSMSSNRIIEEFSLVITKPEELGVFLSEVEGNVLHKNNVQGNGNLSYISRDIFLPGEKFKLFIFRNSKNV